MKENQRLSALQLYSARFCVFILLLTQEILTLNHPWAILAFFSQPSPPHTSPSSGTLGLTLGQGMVQALFYGTGQDSCSQGTRLTKTPIFGGANGRRVRRLKDKNNP